MMHNSSLVFLILASLLVTKVMSQRGNKEIVYKLDKAAKSIGNIKDFCHGQKAWLEGESYVYIFITEKNLSLSFYSFSNAHFIR